MSRQYRSYSNVRRFAPLPDDVVIGLERRAVSDYQRNRARVLLSRLEELDPAGWEAWYDSDAVPEPDSHGWRAVADALQARVLVMEATPAESCFCSSADAAGHSGGPCPVCRDEYQSTVIPF